MQYLREQAVKIVGVILRLSFLKSTQQPSVELLLRKNKNYAIQEQAKSVGNLDQEHQTRSKNFQTQFFRSNGTHISPLIVHHRSHREY